jgi:glycerol uptake facilitator-like aquaporin
MKKNSRNTFKRHGFAYVMGAFFAGSLLLHFIFAYYAQQTNEQNLGYTFLRDVFENWQSEMLQLLLQVSLLAYLWYIGSPQSREGQDRVEAKIDRLIRETLPKDYANTIIREYDEQYPKK